MVHYTEFLEEPFVTPFQGADDGAVVAMSLNLRSAWEHGVQGEAGDEERHPVDVDEVDGFQVVSVYDGVVVPSVGCFLFLGIVPIVLGAVYR